MKTLTFLKSPKDPETGKPIFALTVGKKYDLHYNYDPIGWRGIADNGREEIFFNTDLLFTKRKYHFKNFLGVYTPSQTSSALQIAITINGKPDSIWLDEDWTIYTGCCTFIPKLPLYFIKELKSVIRNHIEAGFSFGFYEYDQNQNRRYGDDLRYTDKEEITKHFLDWSKR